MIARRVGARSGITLVEILISILIMGIGMISLAVLFPLGLLKIRDAARYHRSGMMVQSASDDFEIRALLTKETFTRTWYGSVDPFTSDAIYGPFPSPVKSLAPNIILQPGLPICYDPYWRAFTQTLPITHNAGNALYDPTLTYAAGASVVGEARFGASVVASGNSAVNVFGVRSGSLDAGSPSAKGLQRITNFIPGSGYSTTNLSYLYPYTYSLLGTGVVADTFVSADDVVFNTRDNASTRLSPLLPDLSLTGNSTPIADFRYSWFFTGRQVESIKGTTFQGDVVVCDGRQFAYTPLPGQTVPVPEGETVVEAIFGYSDNIGALGFGVGGDRTVLLRWPTTIPDPVVRIGGWIADVTYERDANTSKVRSVATQTSFQRCNWYQVTKRIDPQPDPNFYPDGNGVYYRRMILTIDSPVKTKTKLAAGGLPYYSNTALIMPSVINVYPRAFAQ